MKMLKFNSLPVLASGRCLAKIDNQISLANKSFVNSLTSLSMSTTEGNKKIELSV